MESVQDVAKVCISLYILIAVCGADVYISSLPLANILQYPPPQYPFGFKINIIVTHFVPITLQPVSI